MSLAWSSPVYLERERLLSQIPQDVGFCLWLLAPAGFGKSVLAGQLAARLGWRTLWASSRLEEPRSALIRGLGLPPKAPWSAVVAALGQEPSLVVLEDLEGTEDLSPLLRTLPALLVLASREELPYLELEKLRSEGRLVRLLASDLAFTLEEAQALFGQRPGAEEAWRATGGWALPLALAALTGEAPHSTALLQGLKESLSPQAFQEGLLLAALPYLPAALATPATHELAGKGLLQHTPEGYRLHVLLQEMARSRLLPELQAAVRQGVSRLPLGLQGEAYLASGLLAELKALLESPASLPLPAEQVLAWCEATGPGGARWRLRRGMALLELGRREGFAELERAAAEGEPGVALAAIGSLVYYHCELCLGQNLEAARSWAARGEALLERVQPELAGRYFNDVARLPFEEGRPQEARQLLQEALRRLPADSPYRIAPQNNLAYLGFELEGQLEPRIAAMEALIPLVQTHLPANLAGHLRDLGRLYLILGDRERGLARLRQAAAVPGDPLASLEARILLAKEENPQQLPALAEQARLWESAYLEERARYYWALSSGNPAVLGQGEGTWYALARAELLGQPELLPDPAHLDRETRLHYHATRYRLLRQQADLEALCGLTTSGARVLAGLVPLELLPKDRPDLARAYPLEAVLASRWKEAVALRREEIPALQVEVLGAFRVWRPYEPVRLEGRMREVFSLLLLGLERDTIAFTLWPDVPEEQARASLSTWLNRLRRALEPWGVATYLGDSGGLERTTSDYQALREALAREDADWLLEHYREPIFPGVDLPIIETLRWEVHHEVRRIWLAQSSLPALKRWLELEPLDEEALERLIPALLQQGQRALARSYYQRYLQALQEIGASPLERLQRLVE